MYALVAEKTVFLLTATPVNNRLLDLQHMIELYSRRQPDYFKETLGVSSLAGHFRVKEKEVEALLDGHRPSEDDGPLVDTNQVEAQRVLSSDSLFRALVVQRSRAYVRKSQEQEGKGTATFPRRE